MSHQHRHNAPPQKKSCSNCKGTLRVANGTTISIECKDCKKLFHKSCTGLHKLSLDAIGKGEESWTCPRCEEKQKIQDHTYQYGGDSTESAENSSKRANKSLRILQWNADGLRTKIDELQLRLKEDDYDVCVIQETKLLKENKTPTVEGYTSLRKDRKNQDGGGGLMTFIKKSLAFETIRDATKDSTETQCFKIKMSKRKWVEICNIYCPPVRSHTTNQNVRLATKTIPSTSESIVLGDFNAHSPIWDQFQPPDERGEAVEDWIINNDMTVLNDGRHTRINHA